MARSIKFLVAACFVVVSPHIAFSQVNNELNPDPTEGVSITSNTDNGPLGEFFAVRDSGVQVLHADGDVQTDLGNANNVNIQYDNDDSGAGSFAITTGGANVLTANNAGTVTIANGMIANGAATLNNTLSVDTNGGGGGGTRFSMDAAAAVTTSTDGNTTSTLNNAGHTLSHVDGTATNSIVVAGVQQETIGSNSFNYGTTIIGGVLVEGDLGVNGSIYALNPTANGGINVGNNGLAINGGSNSVSLVADGNSIANDGRSAVTLEEDQASLVVYNQTTGQAHGLAVDQSQTVLSGGTRSTSLTLDDSGATFRNNDTGGAARVTGVADGASKFDAVNFGQLQDTHAGIASVAAMANIPAPGHGKKFAMGVGFGHFEGENAFAVGGVARITDYMSLQASLGRANENNTFGAGVGFSW